MIFECDRSVSGAQAAGLVAGWADPGKASLMDMGESEGQQFWRQAPYLKMGIKNQRFAMNAKSVPVCSLLNFQEDVIDGNPRLGSCAVGCELQASNVQSRNADLCAGICRNGFVANRAIGLRTAR